MLPLRTTASTIGDPAGLRGSIRAFLLTSLVLAVATVLPGGAPAPLTLALAVTSLGTAAALGLRSRWIATAPHDLLTDDDAPLRDSELIARLRQLYDDHVEQVNLALEEGREDLAEELSDDYMDRALALITADAGVRY